MDGNGTPLTPIQIKTAIKIHQLAAEKEEDYDLLAKELELDISAEADNLLNDSSPDASRQVLQRYD